MDALLLDGKKLAGIVRDEVRVGVAAFRAKYGRVPGLEVILVGEDPASVVYTRNKEKASNEVGMRGKLHTLPASSTADDISALVESLNRNPDVDGILVQMPLPSGIDAPIVLDRIDPAKDVDGLHPANAGLLLLGRGNPSWRAHLSDACACSTWQGPNSKALTPWSWEEARWSASRWPSSSSVPMRP